MPVKKQLVKGINHVMTNINLSAKINTIKGIQLFCRNFVKESSIKQISEFCREVDIMQRQTTIDQIKRWDEFKKRRAQVV
jgi:hypothetical protein